MPKILKWSAGFFAGVFALIAIALAALWIQPEILLNERRIRQAITKFGPQDLKIQWKNLSLQFFADGWREKNVSLSAEGLCLSQVGGLDACISQLDLKFTFSIENWQPTITRIEKVNLQLSHLTLPPGGETAEASALPNLRLPSLASSLSPNLDLSLLGEIEIYLRHVRIESREAEPILAAIKITKLSANQERGEFRLDGGARQKNGFQLDLGGELTVRPESHAFGFTGELEGKAEGWRVSTPLQLTIAETLKLSAKPDFRSAGRDYTARLNLHWSQKDILLKIESLTSKQAWEHGRISLSSCSLESKLDSTGFPLTNGLQCAYSVKPKAKIFPTLDGKLAFSANLKPLANSRASANLKLEEISSGDLLESKIAGSGEFEFDFSNSSIKILAYNFQADLKIPEFSHWKEFWKKTNFAVPAPLHVLTGPITAQVKLENGNKELALANFTLNTDLHSSNQALVLEDKAQIKIQNPFGPDRKIDIDSRLALSDIQLEAPPLRLESPPQFLPDSRFLTDASGRSQEPPAPSSTSWRLQIDSVKPVRISTNMLPVPVPLSVNVVLKSSSPMEGRFGVLPMPLNIFKKKAVVEKLNVTYSGGSKVGELDGLLTHRTPEVLIRVLLLGNTENLRVDFQSDPPLSEQQILAVFLYNKSLTELSEEEANSTQNLSQAMSDGALGLFSLFFLSSTPIQSVGYDPVSQNYSARVGIDEKTTLSVGSDFADVREFGVRRRLGGQWALRTELRQEVNEADVIVTLLEWFKRF